MRRFVDYVLGVSLLLLGLIGFLLPVLPGWLFVFAGLAILGEQRFLRWIKERYLQRFLSKRTRTAENDD